MNKHDSQIISIRLLNSEIEVLKAKAGDQSVGVYIVSQIRKALHHDVNIVKKLELYNKAIHKAGDRVLVRSGRSLIEAVVPELDGDGHQIPT